MRKRISLTAIVSVSCFVINKYDEPTCVVLRPNLKATHLLLLSLLPFLSFFCNNSEKQIIQGTKSDVYEASCFHTQIDHITNKGSRN